MFYGGREQPAILSVDVTGLDNIQGPQKITQGNPKVTQPSKSIEVSGSQNGVTAYRVMLWSSGCMRGTDSLQPRLIHSHGDPKCCGSSTGQENSWSYLKESANIQGIINVNREYFLPSAAANIKICGMAAACVDPGRFLNVGKDIFLQIHI